MVTQVVYTVVALMALTSQISAQWWGQSQLGGWGQGGNTQAAGTGGWNNPADQTRYLTCSDTNANGDDLRLTISLGRNGGSNNDVWGMWGNRFGNSMSLRISARITSGPASPLQGDFQLVATEFSRVEGGCSAQALGDIITDNTWWAQPRTPRGVLGSVIRVMQGQTATSAEVLQNIRFEDLQGRGLTLCPAPSTGSTCTSVLCCRLGLDSQPATSPFTQPQMFPGQMIGGFQQSANGFSNPNTMSNGQPPRMGLPNGQNGRSPNSQPSMNQPTLSF